MEVYNQPIDLSKAVLQPLTLPGNIEAQVLRLDLIHPVVSGNKWFKLKYHLQQAKKGIFTFGGAWSNHLVATAFACKQAGLKSIGIIRGETMTKMLEEARDYGMELQFVSRADYGKQQPPDGYYLVAVGGASDLGIAGASEILDLVDASAFTHIACAVGTGTMMAGLEKRHPHVIGVSSLKVPPTHPKIFYDYHFGGYARHTTVLTRFMNELYSLHQLPTDFVYTAKLLYGVFDLAKQGYFSPKSRVLVIHSGGLQGNRGLPVGTLTFL